MNVDWIPKIERWDRDWETDGFLAVSRQSGKELESILMIECWGISKYSEASNSWDVLNSVFPTVSKNTRQI